MPKSTLKHRIESLAQLRDEIKVHAHLLRSELKDEWVKTEKDWRKIKQHLTPAKRAAKESAKEVKTATRALLGDVKKGYERIKQSLPS